MMAHRLSQTMYRYLWSLKCELAENEHLDLRVAVELSILG